MKALAGNQAFLRLARAGGAIKESVLDNGAPTMMNLLMPLIVAIESLLLGSLILVLGLWLLLLALLLCGSFCVDYLIDLPLLRNRKQRVGRPVEHQT